MAAYWIAHVDVTDPDSRTVWLEGKERARNVVVRFPSVEDAERCYASEVYQEGLSFARGAAERDLCIVEGN